MYRRRDFNARLCRGCGFLHSGFGLRACNSRVRGDRVVDALEAEHGAHIAAREHDRLARRVGDGHLGNVVRCGALRDLDLRNRADGVTGVCQLGLDLGRRQRDAPLIFVLGLVGVSLAFQVAVLAAPDIRRILGRAAVRGEEVADDLLALVGERFARGRVDRSIRLARGVSCAEVDLTVGRVAQVIAAVRVLVRAECERARADRLRLLRVRRPVRVDLIRQNALHIIFNIYIVYNGEVSVRGAAVNEVAVPLVALEPGQTAVRPDRQLLETRGGRKQHLARGRIAHLEGVLIVQADSQLRRGQGRGALEGRAADRTDRVAGRLARYIFQHRGRKRGRAADGQADAQRGVRAHRPRHRHGKRAGQRRRTEQRRKKAFHISVQLLLEIAFIFAPSIDKYITLF